MVKWKQLLKRQFCIVLCSAVVITSSSFNVPGMTGTVEAAGEEVEEPKNLILNPGFVTGGENYKDTGCGQCTAIWWWGHGENNRFTVMDDTGSTISKYVKISRTDSSSNVELTQNIINGTDTKLEDIKDKTQYEFSCLVKLGEECGSEPSEIKAGITVQYKGIEENSHEYVDISNTSWEVENNPVEASKSGWRELKGSFTTNFQRDKVLEGLHFTIRGNVKSFCVAEISLKEANSINILDNPSFDENTAGWSATGSKLEYVPDGEAGGYVLVTNRTATWNSLSQIIKDKVKNNTKYDFKCWVKLSDEYDAESIIKAGLVIKSTGDNGGEPYYDQWGIGGSVVTASKNEWRELKGSFTTKWTGTLEDLQITVADATCTNSFYVDELSIKENGIEKNIPSLKDCFISKSANYDFKVGGAMTADLLSNENKMKLVQKHYNSITPGNEMKPDYIIKGINNDGSLKLDFTIPDTTLDAFWEYNRYKAEKDKIHIRGHVLCWHSQTPAFFFKDKNGNILSKEAMNNRLEEYIKKVLEHVQQKYPGLVYCWDVVNEAIIPSDNEEGGLRVNDGNGETFYHKIYKNSNEYIINAFKYADKYADKQVKLFYNDYGETEPQKVKCISALADAIKAGGGRIDGIGMQAHYSMEYPSADEFYNAVKEYSRHVNEVQITELDMLASAYYDGAPEHKEAEQKKYAERYKGFMDKILQAIDEGVNITAVVFWGVADDDSWLLAPQFSQGRHNMPLLFDENLKAKPAFWEIIGASKPEKP